MSEQPEKDGAHLLSQIMIVVLVFAAAVGMLSIWTQILRGNELTVWQKVMFAGGYGLVVAGVIFVGLQRKKMRKNETFRREKW